MNHFSFIKWTGYIVHTVLLIVLLGILAIFRPSNADSGAVTNTTVPTRTATPELRPTNTLTPTQTPTRIPTINPPAQGQTHIFLPITQRPGEAVNGPDLIVSKIEIGQTEIVVTLKNIGNQPVTQPFWVDSYIDPVRPPTQVNQPFETLTSNGFVWGVGLTGDDAGAVLPLEPYDEMVLTVGGKFYHEGISRFPAGVIEYGALVYVQVDSFGTSPLFGQVEETHEMANREYNNISSAVAP